MGKLVGILAILMVAYTVSAFTIEADKFAIADAPPPGLFEPNENCPCTGYDLHAAIEGCAKCGECVLERGATYPFELGFTPRRNLIGMLARSKLYFVGFLLKEDEKDYPEKNATANVPYLVVNDFEVSQDIPPADYQVTYEIFGYDDQEHPVVCMYKCGVRVV